MLRGEDWSYLASLYPFPFSAEVPAYVGLSYESKILRKSYHSVLVLDFSVENLDQKAFSRKR